MTDDFTIREQANKSAEKHNVTFHTEEYVNGYYLGYKAGFHECEKEHEWHDLEKKLKTSLDYNKSLLNALKNCGASRLNSGLIERAEYFIKEN